MVVGLEPTRKITCLIPFFFLQTSISSFRTLNHHLTLSPCGTDENRTHIVGFSDRCLDQLGNSSICTSRRLRSLYLRVGAVYVSDYTRDANKIFRKTCCFQISDFEFFNFAEIFLLIFFVGPGGFEPLPFGLDLQSSCRIQNDFQFPLLTGWDSNPRWSLHSSD